jgi:hypothetical protein
MSKLNEEQIVKKWGPVINDLKFKTKKDRAMACKYAELHALVELSEAEMLTNFPVMRSTAIDQPPLVKNLLPISLKVLAGINDLSKLHFTGQPVFKFIRNNEWVMETVKAHGISISLSQEDYQDISQQLGIDIINNLESVIIQEVTEKLNTLIEEGNEIYMFLVVAGIRMISEGKDTFNPQLTLISRYHAEPTSVSIEDL